MARDARDQVIQRAVASENGERVARLAAFMDASYEAGQSRSNLVDLVVDAMHFADAHGLQIDDVMVSARNHHSAEKSGE